MGALRCGGVPAVAEPPVEKRFKCGYTLAVCETTVQSCVCVDCERFGWPQTPSRTHLRPNLCCPHPSCLASKSLLLDNDSCICTPLYTLTTHTDMRYLHQSSHHCSPFSPVPNLRTLQQPLCSGLPVHTPTPGQPCYCAVWLHCGWDSIACVVIATLSTSRLPACSPTCATLPTPQGTMGSGPRSTCGAQPDGQQQGQLVQEPDREYLCPWMYICTYPTA